MALVKCADCGKDVSGSAPACPHCGRPTPRKTTDKAEVGKLVVAAIFAIGLFAVWFEYGDDIGRVIRRLAEP